MKARYLLLCAALCLSLCSCAPKEAGEPSSEAGASDSFSPSSYTEGEETVFVKEFGRYRLPAGFVESETHSTEKKWFYILEGHDQDDHPSNISVETGVNRYSADQHSLFWEAILRQLASQLDGSGASLAGSGSSTEQGYVLYTFTVTPAEDDPWAAVSTQYYIVGEKQYVLVFETNWGEDSAVTEAALHMVNSFQWGEE